MRGDLRKSLLEREMTRKEFLQVAGGSLLALVGMTNFAEMLIIGNKPTPQKAPSKDSKYAFGIRRFGV